VTYVDLKMNFKSQAIDYMKSCTQNRVTAHDYRSYKWLSYKSF